MKRTTTLGLFMLVTASFWSCKKTGDSPPTQNFTFQSQLDSLNNGLIDYGNEEINKSYIRLLNFQKKHNTGEKVGTVIPKTLITQAVNGFTDSGINLPLDSSNYVKWDFMVVYPGIAINTQNEEKYEPSVFFFKGQKDGSGNLIPVGKPVLDIQFRGGGGGPGDGTIASPPPKTIPKP